MEDRLANIDGHKGLKRDTQTFGIVSDDKLALKAARERKEAILKDKEKIVSLEEKIAVQEIRLARLESILLKSMTNGAN